MLKQLLQKLFPPHPRPVPEVEKAAAILLNRQGFWLPQAPQNPEKNRHWTNGIITITQHFPTGSPPSVLMIHAMIDGVIRFVYLSGDSRNAAHFPGQWEKQLAFLSKSA